MKSQGGRGKIGGALTALGLLVGCATQAAPIAPETSTDGTHRATKQSPSPPPSSQHASAVELRFPREDVPWMGVELRATQRPEAGVEVVRVMAGSPAAKSGIESGDVLIALGGRPVQAPAEVADWVQMQPTGTTHPVNIVRVGEQRLLRVVLEGRPQFEDQLRLELVGRPAPEISGVATFQGEASSLKELHGQVVILEFWASFCGVCRFLGPHLDRWHRLYQPQGAEVVGITVDPPQLGLRAAERSGMSYTLASDPEAKITRAYMASQIPVVIIIDRSGIVRDIMVGYAEDRLRETEALVAHLVDQDL